jgi:AraC-like DNA-binding protein
MLQLTKMHHCSREIGMQPFKDVRKSFAEDALEDFGPPYITLAHTFNAPHGWSIRDRTLNQYALQYVVDGIARYPIQGQDYTTVKGDLLLHRPGELHSIFTEDHKPYVCISLVFHFGLSPFPLDSLFKGVHYLGNFSDHQLELQLSRLVTLYQQPSAAAQLECKGLLLQILAEAQSTLNQRKLTGTRELEERSQRNRAKLILIKNYISEHYRDDIQHQDLERVCGYSRNYIITQFKGTFGMSPMQYLTLTRVQKAKELAVQSQLSISEIAALVGYSDVHTFGKMFKKKTGTSLSQFTASLVMTH